MKYFFYSFFFLAVTMFLLSTDGIIFQGLKTIGFMHAVDPFFAVLALVCIGAVPLNLMKRDKLKNIFFKIFAVLAVVVLIISLYNWKPVSVYQQGRFIYWGDSRGLFVNVTIGLVSSLTLLTVVVFFVIQGLKAKEKFVKTRAFLIASGLTIIAIMSVLNYIVGAILTPYVLRLICTIMNVFAGMLILRGIYYGPKQISVATALENGPESN